MGNKALRFLSTCSLELFLIHGYIASWLFDKLELNDFVMFALVIAVSVACAAIIAPLDRFLIKHISGFLSAEKKPIDRKAVYKLVIALALIILAAFAYIDGRHFVFAKAEYNQEMEALKRSEIGDEVEFGHFDTDLTIPGKETVLWLVIEKDENTICLLSKMGLGGSFYHQKHEEVVWEDSDIRTLLNSKEYLDMFNRYEKDAIISNNKDFVSLMSVSQAESFFSSDPERELAITQAAEAKGTNVNHLSKANYWDIKSYDSSWWWLKGTGSVPDIYAPIVTEDGVIKTQEKVVNKPSGAIRPLIYIKLEK